MRYGKLPFEKAAEGVGKHEVTLITFHAATALRVAATAHQGRLPDCHRAGHKGGATS